MIKPHGPQIADVPGAYHVLDLTERQGVTLLRQSFAEVPDLSNGSWIAVATRFDDVLLLARHTATPSTPQNEGLDTYGLYSVARGRLLLYAEAIRGPLQNWCNDNARWIR